MRMEKQRTARMTNAMLMPRMTGTRVGGSAKFGWIPGGGLPAGVVLSKARGMLSMSFGSISLIDMIMKELSWHNKSYFCNERQSIDLIYFSIAIKSKSPCSRVALRCINVTHVALPEASVSALECRRRRYQHKAIKPSQRRMTE